MAFDCNLQNGGGICQPDPTDCATDTAEVCVCGKTLKNACEAKIYNPLPFTVGACK